MVRHEGDRRPRPNERTNPASVLRIDKLPHSLEAEMIVLGSMMLDNAMIPIVVERLADGAAFYVDSHAKLYQAIVSLYDHKIAIEPSVILAELRRRGQLEQVGGMPFLARLETTVIAADNVEPHAEEVLENYRKRRVIEESMRLIDSAMQPLTIANEIAESAMGFFLKMHQGRIDESPRLLWDLFREEFAELERLVMAGTRRDGALIGIPEIDDEYGGVKRDDLIVIGADPSVGKTAFYLQSMEAVTLSADSKGLPGLMFSMDASWEEVLHRYITRATEIPLARLARADLTKRDLERIQRRAGPIHDLPLYIDDSSGLRIETIEARALRTAAKHGGLSSIGIDYAQLISGDESLFERLQESMPRLKALGKRIGCPVFVLSQLNQKDRKDGIPTLESLQYGAPMKQEATRVYLLWRDRSLPTEPVNLSIAKIKRGRPKIIKLLFEGIQQRFVPFNDCGTNGGDEIDPITGRPMSESLKQRSLFDDDLPS